MIGVGGTGHSLGALESVQEFEQLIAGIKSFCPLAIIWPEFRKRRLFEFEACVEIGLSCLDRLVAEPKGGDGTIDTSLEQFHGGGVSPVS